MHGFLRVSSTAKVRMQSCNVCMSVNGRGIEEGGWGEGGGRGEKEDDCLERAGGKRNYGGTQRRTANRGGTAGRPFHTRAVRECVQARRCAMAEHPSCVA